jgi:outer membrane protein
MIKLVGAALLAAILALPAVGLADIKIGVVDTADILSKSAEWKRAQDTVKKKVEDMGRPLDQRRQDINKQLQELEQQAQVMKDDARKRRAEEIQKKLQELQRSAADADKSLAQFEEKEKAPILQKLQAAVEAVAKDEKLDIVFQNQGLFLNNKSLDITEKVRSRFR